MNRTLKRQIMRWTTLATLLAMAAAPALLPLSSLAEPATPVAASSTVSIPKATGNSLRFTLKHFGDPNGYRLKTVRTQRDYPFTKPKGWLVQPSSNIHLTFQHGANLLPERSSLNVLVNNRILKSIPLAKSNVVPTTVNIPVPPELLKDNNILSFQVDQHYTYKCEDPFSEELWTELLPDTAMTLNYTWDKVHPDLAQYPFPLLDPLNNYSPTVVGYVVPYGASDQTLEAFGTVAAHLGQQAGWRSLRPYVGDEGSLNSSDNLIMVGTPQENPAISSISSSFEVPLSGGQFSDPKGGTLPEGTGVLQMVPNPHNPTRTILVVSGNGPEGVKKAAHALAQNQVNKVMAGRSAIIKDFSPGAEYPYRSWDGFILKSGDSFSELGLNTQTTRGITGLPLFYQLKLMPDIFLPGKRNVRLHTIYSYASQLDHDQSQLEVTVNGKSIKSVKLDDPNGRSLAEFVVDIPTEEFHTFNDLEFKFHLFPNKYDLCRFVTDVHIWGTVHNTSWVEFPGELKAALPDVGLVNDGGYPFTIYQDMSHLAFVLPQSVVRTDLEAMLQFVTRMGRESASRKGLQLTAYHANALPDNVKKDSHLVVIGQPSQNPLIKELRGKATLLTEGSWNTLQEDQKKKIAELNYASGQGVIEEVLSPWNDSRVALLMTGENDTALVRDAQVFQNDNWYANIKQGNLVVVNDNGPQSAILLEKGQARFFRAQDLQGGFHLPDWGWIALGFFSLIGVISVLRFLFGR